MWRFLFCLLVACDTNARLRDAPAQAEVPLFITSTDQVSVQDYTFAIAHGVLMEPSNAPAPPLPPFQPRLITAETKAALRAALPEQPAWTPPDADAETVTDYLSRMQSLSPSERAAFKAARFD